MNTGQRIVLQEDQPDGASASVLPVERFELDPLPADTSNVPLPPTGEPSNSPLPPAGEGGRRPGEGLRLAKLGLGLAAALLTLQTATALHATFQQSVLLGAAWTAALGLLGFAAGRAGWRLLRRLRQLKAQQDLRAHAEQLLQHQGITEGLAFCEQLAHNAGITNTEPYAQWKRQLSAAHNDREVMQLYGRTVLADADERALARVRSHAGDVTVMVAVSYFPAVDMLLVLWRQLKLVEEVSAAYGVDPGYWGRITLLRKVLRNMALAGAAEVATEVGVEVLGAGLAARLSAAAAQGVAAGILTARLGLRTMDACRAIPWEPEQKPRLREVTGGLVDTAKRYLLEKQGPGEA